MEAAIYCRISKDPRGTFLGVDRQEEDCRALARRNGWTVRRVLVDNDLSAYNGKPRPAYKELLASLERGEVEVVIAWSHDRLHRRPSELEEYVAISEKHGIATHTVRAGALDLTTPSGRAIARTLAAWASYESETNSDRQRRARLQAARSGLPMGGTRAFGYEADGLNIRPDEAEVYRDLVKRLLNGESLGMLVNYLNDNGITTVRGNKWSRHVLKDTLLRKRYIGIRTHHDNEYPARWEPLITPAMRDLMIATIADNRNNCNTRRWVRAHMLVGLAFCSRCGNKLTASSKRMHPGHKPTTVYQCRKYNAKGEVVGCSGISRVAVPLEEFVTLAVLDRLDSPVMAEALAKLDHDSDQLVGLYNELELRRLKLDELVDDYAAGVLTKAQFTRAKGVAEAELTKVSDALERATRDRKMAVVPPAQEIKAAWEASDIEWKHTILELLIDKIIVHPQRKRPYWRDTKQRFDPDAIEIVWKF